MAKANLPEIEKLILEIRSGSETAFMEFYDRYANALNSAILSYVRNKDTAEDILQETFVKVWKNIQFYDESKGSVFTWMMQIARNASIDVLRKQQKMKPVEIQEANTHVIGSEQTNIQVIGLTGLIEKLPEEQQQIIDYLYYKGYTQQELADELGLPLGTVKTRSRIALRELRKWFTVFLFWI